MIGLALIAIAPNARAEIASKAYVDEQDNNIIFGREDIVGFGYENMDELVESGGVMGRVQSTEQSVEELNSSVEELNSSVEELNSSISSRVEDISSEIESVRSSTDSFVGDIENINSDLEQRVKTKQNLNNAFLVTTGNGDVKLTQKVNLSHLAFPTPPASCSTKGCMLMFYNNNYVWEPVTRDTNETIATTGAVSAATSKIDTGGTTIPANCSQADGEGGCLD